MPENEYERLIELVKACPPIYDTKSKIFRNKALTINSWEYIARTMGKEVDQCKHVWMGLRSTYARHLNKEKSGKPMVWVFADKMEFLREHMLLWPRNRQLYRRMKHSDCTAGRKNSETQSDEKTQGNTAASFDDTSFYIIDDSSSESEKEDEENNCPPSNQIQKSCDEELKSQSMSDSGTITDEREQSISIFFQSILFDLRRLSDRQLRSFKEDVYLTLNKYLDAQEADDST